MNKKPYTLYAVEDRPRLWRGILVWAAVGVALLVLAVTGVGYLWFRGQVAEGNDRVEPEIRAALTGKPTSNMAANKTAEEIPELPSAMNVLVIGSDKREQDEGDPARSDTVILVHVDPDQDYLSLLSLPRDLRVDIPGHGKNKLNYAYAVGGPALAIRTVEQLTGVDINHYVEVDFQAFRDIVDALGGVYIDVDRRYYNDNPEYELIKLAPGYQLLDGDQALDYVRFRHDQNLDFGRMERQQMFLSAVKEQAMTWHLPFKLPGVISALFDNLATDLGANDILKLAYWGIRLEPGQTRMLTVTGSTGELEGVSYVLVNKQSLAALVGDFLTPPGKGTTSTGAHSATSSGVSTTTPSTTVAGSEDAGGDSLPHVYASASPSSIPDAGGWKAIARQVPYAVRAPAYLPENFVFVERMPPEGATYDIQVGDGTKPAFKMLYRLRQNGKYMDQVMGITETTWLDAPAACKGKEVKRGDITYTVVGSHGKADRVWFKADGVLYWVSNTLSHLLSEDELLAVAMSMIYIPPE